MPKRPKEIKVENIKKIRVIILMKFKNNKDERWAYNKISNNLGTRNSEQFEVMVYIPHKFP